MFLFQNFVVTNCRSCGDDRERIFRGGKNNKFAEVVGKEFQNLRSTSPEENKMRKPLLSSLNIFGESQNLFFQRFVIYRIVGYL